MEPDLGRWFIDGSLRRSWWGSSGRGDCRGTATENVEKAMAPRAPPWPFCTCFCLCHTAERPKAAQKSCFRGCLRWLWEASYQHLHQGLSGAPCQSPAGRATCPGTGTRCCGARVGKPQAWGKHYSCPVAFIETFLVLLPLLQLCLDLRGLVTANKSLAFLTALWGLLSHLSKTESLAWASSKMISPVLAGAETACLGEASWSAEHESLDEMKW